MNKRSQIATEGAVVEGLDALRCDFESNKSSTSTNKLSIEYHAADDAAQNRNTNVRSEQLSQPLQSVSLDHPADRSQQVGIQLRITSAFPKPKNVSTEDNTITSVTTIKTNSVSKQSMFECSSSNVQHIIIETVNFLSVSEGYKGQLSPRSSTGSCVILGAPPKCLASSAPDPAPPPLRSRQTRSHCVNSVTVSIPEYASLNGAASDLTGSMKVNWKTLSMLSDLLHFEEKIRYYKQERGTYAVRGSGSFGGAYSTAANDEEGPQIIGQYCGCFTTPGRSCCKWIIYLWDVFKCNREPFSSTLHNGVH